MLVTKPALLLQVNEISWSLSGEYFFLTCGSNGEGIVEVMRFSPDASMKPLRSVRFQYCYGLPANAAAIPVPFDSNMHNLFRGESNTDWFSPTQRLLSLLSCKVHAHTANCYCIEFDPTGRWAYNQYVSIFEVALPYLPCGRSNVRWHIISWPAALH